MQVSQILAAKGAQVVTIGPEATIADAVASLKRKGIGALVVTDDAGGVIGILSERDVVRGLARHGRGVLDKRVEDLMSREVVTCGLESRVEELMRDMTVRRIRHLPVVEDGRLVGIVSIGDVVKTRLEELETETTLLREYIVGSS